MHEFLPWQTADAQRLLNHPDQLPHALLIFGMAGCGKHEFALALAATLLCEDRKDGWACGTCEGCRLVASGNHPDLARVRPEALAAREGAGPPEDDAQGQVEQESTAAGKRKLSEELRIDQIRALEPWYHRATHRGGWRIVVLYPADALSVVSANALLKALEEPPPNTLFFMTSDAPDRLLPTIVSRCQKFALSLPDHEQSTAWLSARGINNPETWLAACAGAPLAALALSETLDAACPSWAQSLIKQIAQGSVVDVASLADTLAKSPALGWLSVLQRLSFDLTLAGAGLPLRYYPDLQSLAASVCERVSLDQATDLCHWINQQATLASHPLNSKLFAQACVQRFCDVVS